MSYCRIGKGSDVYVIRGGDVLICFCSESFEADDEETMISHLIDHRERGDKVPQRGLDRLNAERLGLPARPTWKQALEGFWPRLTPPREGQVE